MALTLVKGGASDSQPRTADEAWERYAALTKQTVEDPKLLYDRAWVERQRRAYLAFCEIFDAHERRA